MLNEFTNTYMLSVNFTAHFLIFIGTFYVALQNRNLPRWHVTPLWYAGLCSLLTAISILIQWAEGPQSPMSYQNIGYMSEVLLNIAVASIAVIMLISTVSRDIQESKKRKLKE